MGIPIGGFGGTPTLTPSLSSNPATPASTGLSAYAADLQNALNRSIGLAALPLTLLQSQQSQLSSESSALSVLNTQFSVLQSTITNLDSAARNIVSSAVSDASILSASAGAGALPGVYTVNVTDPGSFASALSVNSLPIVTDPTTQNISAASSFTLTVNGVTQTITPATNTLNALAAAINADTNAGVQATIVNIGPPSAPDYRLSLQSNALGNVSIQLNDGTSDLLTPLTTGTLAQYQVNGSPATPIQSNSRSVTVAPGVTVQLLKTGSSTVTVSQTPSSIISALSSFVTSFNAAVDELNKSFGQNSGPLNGQSIVFDLKRSIHGLASYTGGSGTVTSLTDLGLSFDTNGHLNFDATALSGAAGAAMSDISSFLGGATSGGFLQFATDQLSAIEDPATGIINTTINSVSNQITHQNQLISDKQAYIKQLQTSLQAKMAAADAAIAQIESQVSFFTGLFQSMYLPKTQQF
ncbi:MAG: flagellar hook-associated 2 domain protein [Bryobacterales bacterium]|nr:flagellar hook-associated 2 domain protein [Bryobacterales bacterium]